MDKRVQKIKCERKVTKTYGNMKNVKQRNVFVELIIAYNNLDFTPPWKVLKNIQMKI